MPVEIEHKYLVNLDRWKEVSPDSSTPISQAYIHTEPGKSVRVRTKGEKAFLTIKGKGSGASQFEFEYEIPVDHAHTLIDKFCEAVIEKVRHEIVHEGKLWEVDEFLGKNKGLWVAEIELSSEGESYEHPDWVEEEVTNDHRYKNSSLSKNPFCNWT